ncbi:MAG: hypothetical protein ACOYNU_10115 [Bacteroidales bacterium]
MKTSKRYKVKPEKIHSLNDISLEKQRLRFEITKAEENIHTGYHNILEAFTLKNIVTTVASDLSATSSIVSKAFDFGKTFMSKHKKKKHNKSKENSDDPES